VGPDGERCVDQLGAGVDQVGEEGAQRRFLRAVSGIITVLFGLEGIRLARIRIRLPFGAG